MCGHCKDYEIGRRDLLKVGAASLVALALAGLPGPARAAEGAPTALTPDEALAQLKAGNARYVSDPQLCSIDLAQQRGAVAGHQAPWATIISLSLIHI